MQRKREEAEEKKRREEEQKRLRDEAEARANQKYICGCIPVGGGGEKPSTGVNDGGTRKETSPGDVELSVGPGATSGAAKNTVPETKVQPGQVGGGGAGKTAKQRKLERLRALHQKRAQHAAGNSGAATTSSKSTGGEDGKARQGGDNGRGKDGAARDDVEAAASPRLDTSGSCLKDVQEVDYFSQFDLLVRIIIQTLNPDMQTPERQVAFVDMSADSWSIESGQTSLEQRVLPPASFEAVEISMVRDSDNGGESKEAGKAKESAGRRRIGGGPTSHVLKSIVNPNFTMMALLQDFGAYYGVGELYQILSELTAYVQNLRGALMAPGQLKKADDLVDHINWITGRLQKVGVLSFNPGPEQTPPTQRELHMMQVCEK